MASPSLGEVSEGMPQPSITTVMSVSIALWQVDCRITQDNFVFELDHFCESGERASMQRWILLLQRLNLKSWNNDWLSGKVSRSDRNI
jgi:hypothetical protein